MFAQNLNPLSNKLLADFKKALKEDNTIKNIEYAQLRVGDIITLSFLSYVQDVKKPLEIYSNIEIKATLFKE